VTLSALARTIVLAAFLAIAAGWAVARHYARVERPMLVPVRPAASPAYDGEAGEIPVPEMIEPDGN
jgi:hypothetical protein